MPKLSSLCCDVSACQLLKLLLGIFFYMDSFLGYGQPWTPSYGWMGYHQCQHGWTAPTNNLRLHLTNIWKREKVIKTCSPYIEINVNANY